MPQRNSPRKKRKKNNYFTKIHEDAIIKYATSSSRSEKSQLYMELIGPAFNEMVNKIVFTYKFNNLPNIESLRDECKIWLTTILDKYDPSKGSKAFSYFSVVTKNWFIHKVKKNSKKIKQEVSYEGLVQRGGADVLGASDQDTGAAKYLNEREYLEFWNTLLENIDLWESHASKESEIKVIKAVKVLLHNIEDIEIFNKKAIYLYLRELTGMNTKQVVNNLNKVREKYRNFKTKWDKDLL